MKKIVLSTLAAVTVASSLSALSLPTPSSKVFDKEVSDTAMSSVDFAYGKTDLDTVSADSMNTYNLTSTFIKHISKGFGVGFGMNAEMIVDKALPNDSITNVGGELKVGYTLGEAFHIPLFFRAGAGYGYAYNSNAALRGGGFQWSADVNYRLWKHLGVGVRYKSLNANFSDGIPSDTFKTTLGYVSIVF